MNRRSFLKTAALTTAGAAAYTGPGPLLLGMDDKAGSKTPRVGSGEHTYECFHGWGNLPGELEWQTTHNVAIDSAGQIYITHQGHKNMKGLDTTFVFDAAGKFIRSFGKEWHTGGHGIDIRKEGNTEYLYLTNTWANPKVVKMTVGGEIVWKLGRPEAPEYADTKKNYNPTNVAFCPDGSFFIGDGYGSNSMLKYSADGKLLKIFGGTGNTEGKFRTPHGNWVDTRNPAKPMLIVCDRANARLQTFDLDGNFLSMTDKGTVLFPAHADIRGDVLLVPDLHARVSLFDKAGKPIVHLGDDDAWRKKVLDGYKVRTQPKEWQPGKFVHPHDACFDAAGNIYVVEWVQGGRITFLKKVA